MGIINRILPVILFPLLALSCTAQTDSSAQQPASRQQVVDNLKPIVQVEERGRMLTMAMQQLPLMLDVGTEDAEKLKEHYDVYYVHHNAATISLAQGNLNAYRGHLEVASAELDSIEERLKTIIKNSESQHPRG